MTTPRTLLLTKALALTLVGCAAGPTRTVPRKKSPRATGPVDPVPQYVQRLRTARTLDARTAALFGLTQVLDPRGVDALIALVRSPAAHTPLRVQAARALARMRSPRAIAPLWHLRHDEKPALARAARAALDALCRASPGASAELLYREPRVTGPSRPWLQRLVTLHLVRILGASPRVRLRWPLCPSDRRVTTWKRPRSFAVDTRFTLTDHGSRVSASISVLLTGLPGNRLITKASARGTDDRPLSLPGVRRLVSGLVDALEGDIFRSLP